QSSVLTALREVEDSLVSYDRERIRRNELAGAVTANQRSLDLSNQLYEKGLIPFLNVLDAQRSLLLSQQALVDSETTVSTNLVSLYKALGGGWDEAAETGRRPQQQQQTSPPTAPTTQQTAL